jgi:hypothetical protein
MRRLDIDFAPKRLLPAWAWHVASAALWALAFQQGWSAWTLHSASQALQSRVASLQAKQDAAVRQEREAEDKANMTPPYAKDAAEIARVAAYPTEAALATLESTQIAGIKLIALDISPKDQIVQVDVEYSDQTALVHYLEALNDNKAAGTWDLRQAQPTKEGGTSKGNARLVTTRYPSAVGLGELDKLGP